MGKKNKGKRSGSSLGSNKKTVKEIQEPDFGLEATKSKENPEHSIGDKKLRAQEQCKKLDEHRLEEISKVEKKDKTEHKKKSIKNEEIVGSKKTDDNHVDYSSYTKFNKSIVNKQVASCSKNGNSPDMDYWDVEEVSAKTDDAFENSKRKQFDQRNDFKSPARSYQKGSSHSTWQATDGNKSKNEKQGNSKYKQSANFEFNYDIFESKLNKIKLDFGKVEEVKGDLFDAPIEFSLAHCVAEDFSMGAGIAVQFRKEFKGIPELLSQNVKTGQVAVLRHNDRFIYYLVTKKFSNSKPTLRSLWDSLLEMKQHMIENKVRKLAMPQIGCGLDRLDWGDVKQMMDYIFQDSEVGICVYSLDLSKTSRSQSSSRGANKGYKKHVGYPLRNIECGTGHIFFGTEDGSITDELRSLDEKFPGLIEFYLREKKISGGIIKFRNRNEYIYGLIWKNTQYNEIDYKNLAKCLYNLKKTNQKDRYEYFGFDAFMDDNDGDLKLEKIINMFQSILYDVTIYICWPEKIICYKPNF